ncbi:MAG: glycosyltransferase [Candidatus Omnitrophota bacterium]|nr:glycosyltransferase [Candidatus Omnitrophota bacterium]
MKKITAVVVTYKRPDYLKKSLESMRKQAVLPDKIIVIDNSPGNETQRMIEEHFPFVGYRHFPDNIGSEGGFSEGIRLAYKDSDYVWLFDDDCISGKNALSELIKWAEMLEKEAKVGAVRSARPWDRRDDVPVLEIEDLIAWRGAMIFSEVVERVGLPEKDFFLYGGDIEYGLRIRKAGYRIYLVFSSKINSLEYSKKIRRKFGRILTESYRQPFRIYYSYRNELWVHMKHKRYREVLKIVLCGLKNFCFHIFNGEVREAGAIIEGFGDAFRDRLGKHKKYLP